MSSNFQQELIDQLAEISLSLSDNLERIKGPALSSANSPASQQATLSGANRKTMSRELESALSEQLNIINNEAQFK